MVLQYYSAMKMNKLLIPTTTWIFKKLCWVKDFRHKMQPTVDTLYEILEEAQFIMAESKFLVTYTWEVTGIDFKVARKNFLKWWKYSVSFFLWWLHECIYLCIHWKWVHFILCKLFPKNTYNYLIFKEIPGIFVWNFFSIFQSSSLIKK